MGHQGSQGTGSPATLRRRLWRDAPTAPVLDGVRCVTLELVVLRGGCAREGEGCVPAPPPPVMMACEAVCATTDARACSVRARKTATRPPPPARPHHLQAPCLRIWFWGPFLRPQALSQFV